jgi:2'-5' RNA ligase
MNTFIAIMIPEGATQAIGDAVEQYKGVLATPIVNSMWHITLAFYGNRDFSSEEVETISAVIRQSFLPTVTILSIGKGVNEIQLWARVQSSQVLSDLHEIFLARGGVADTRDFVPHINLGTLKDTSSTLGVPDAPVKTTFTVHEAMLLQSENGTYERIATIPLTP